MTSSVSEQLILWGGNASPYVRKVRVALEEKAIPYTQHETVPIRLLNALGKPIPEEFARCSPLGKIPAIQWGDYCLADSTAIVDFLERQFPEGRHLLPHEPKDCGQALWFEAYAGDRMGQVINQGIFVPTFVQHHMLQQPVDHTEVGRVINEDLPGVFAYLEQSITGKQWLAGGCFSVADIAVVSHLISLQLCEIAIDHVRWPQLFDYCSRVMDRPSFQRVLA